MYYFPKFRLFYLNSLIYVRSLTVSAAQSIKKLAWLMFVLGKIKILRRVEDIAEMAFLLFACLYWAVILIPVDVECDLVERKYW